MNELFDNQVEAKKEVTPLIAVTEEWDDLEHAYDLEIAHDVIFELQVMKSREMRKESDLQKRKKMVQEIDMMRYELKALHENEQLQRSIIDKALRLYAPIIKSTVVCKDQM
jgi:hypothetical protein